MAKAPAKSVRIYVGHIDVSGFATALDMGITQPTPVVTTFGDTGPRRLVAGYDHTASVTALLDPATTTGWDASAYAWLQSATDLSAGIFFEGIAENSVAYEGLYQLTAQPRQAAIAEAIGLNLEAAGSNHHGRGLVLRSATVTTTGNGTGRNMGATTSGQIVAATFRVLGGTFTSITAAIQESQNDGGGDAYANITGLTSGSMTTTGTVRVTTTAATEAWKRVNVSAFAGTSCQLLITLTHEAETI